MTLLEHLEDSRHESARWPGGKQTWRMLSLFLQGLDVASFGGAAREPLLNCDAVLHDVARKTDDPELRAEAEAHLAGIAKTLRTIYGD